MIISKTNLYWILIPGFLLSLLTIFLAIWFGEFETTIFGPGDDVRFGTWHLNTWWEWSLWFALQLALGILDVFFYEYVQPHFNFVVNDDTYKIKQYGTGTQSDILLLTFENSLAFFPSMIRVTLAVLFVNTQILSVLLVQVIKEFIIFALVYFKLLNKKKEGKFTGEKKYIELEPLSTTNDARGTPMGYGPHERAHIGQILQREEEAAKKDKKNQQRTLHGRYRTMRF
jgi:hypothetical protein